jgi:hypothetical protein
VAIRLLVALGFGVAIAALYHFTRPKEVQGTSFPMTILMLCVLIAMVTQVIGDSVARAFSLVGALSIVRFRTVVRDTQDTAWVILSVVVGMAVGARNPWVAAIGLGVVAVAELGRMALPFKPRSAPSVLTLRLRVSPDHDPEILVKSALGGVLATREFVSAATLEKGEGTEASWKVTLRPDSQPGNVIAALRQIPGVRSVRIEQTEPDD